MTRGRQGEDPEPRSILVVLPTWVGDFVMATPALRALRQRFADARVVFLMEPNLRDLVRGAAWMDETVCWPPKGRRGPQHRELRDLVWDLRRRRFDWCVLLPNSFRSALLARLVGAKRRIGFDRDGRRWLLTDPIPVPNRRTGGQTISGPHRSEEHCSVSSGTQGAAKDGGSDDPPFTRSRGTPCTNVRLTPVGGMTDLPVPRTRYEPYPLVEYYADLAEAIGCPRPDDRLELATTPDAEDSVAERLAALGIADHHPLVVLSPGARYGAAKCWAPERFAEVSDRLIEADEAAVVITCGPGEEAIARRIGSFMSGGAQVFDDPVLTLGELKSLVKRCDLLICNDAGPRHFAKAFSVPVVTVFGPTHPHWTDTNHEAERIVRIDVDCGPCQQRTCPLGHLKCMTGVTTEAVVGAARELLQTRIAHGTR